MKRPILLLLIAGWMPAFQLPALDLPEDRTLSPYFVVLDLAADEAAAKERFPLKSTDVQVNISGVMAEVEVKQVYHNTGSSVIEAVYVFPGSTRAAVHGMRMKIGDREIDAVIQERKQAKETYEKAKRENKSASLLEQRRPNVFQMNVANILPGDRVEITLNYTEYLAPVEHTYEFVFPTVVGPRYSNTAAGSPNAADEAWVENPYLQKDVESPASFAITTRINAGMSIQRLVCPTHKTVINYTGAESADVGLAAEEVNGGDRDYILQYQLKDQEIATGLLLHRDERRQENFFMLTVQPPERVTPSQIPGREYIFVVDVSGSMDGFPLNTAKTLMKTMLGGLRSQDRFGVLLFASASKAMAERLLPATEDNVKRALAWLDAERGGGGTELLPALRRALGYPGDENYSRSMILITDGFISLEREAFELVRQNRGKASVFAFGVGSSVNRYLLEGLARVGRGEPFVLTDPAQSQKLVKRLHDYIASPVLTNVKVKFDGLEVYDVEPLPVPDLLAQRPVTLVGKWKGKPSGSVRISGISGDRLWTRSLRIERSSFNHPALPYLWARDRVAALSDYHKWGGETRDQVVDLGLKYNLLTEFTSFVAVDKVVRNVDGLTKETVKQPLPLPRGVPPSAVGNGAVPEPEHYLLILLAGVAFWYHWRRLQLGQA